MFWKQTWPKIQQMHKYPKLDTGGSSTVQPQQWANVEEESEINKNVCKKQNTRKYTNKNNITELFIVCCIHTICYSFHLMLVPEGRKELFKVLFKRILCYMLNHLNVIFDAACQGGEYCVR